jgi:membrane associated rhomboid family serine protease
MSANGDVLRERFLATPLVTRHMMAATWVICLLNPIFGVDDLLVASPYDIIRKGQLWRLATSIAYVPGLINALIMSFVLYRLGSAWEQERGSIRILCYFLLAIVATNAGVCVLAILVAPLAPSVMSPAFLCGPGILSAFLVLITRSSQGYAGASVSILGLFTMPTLYFPLLLLAFFAMFGANPLESAASVGVGYAWSRGYLDPVVPSDDTLAAMESWPSMQGACRARGYVSVAAAGPTLPSTGPGAQGGTAAPGRDSVNDLIAQLRDHAFAGGARSRGPRGYVDARGAKARRRGGGWSSGRVAGSGRRRRRRAEGRRVGARDARADTPEAARVRACARGRVAVGSRAGVARAGGGAGSGSERPRGHQQSGGGAGGSAAARELTREERAAAFARAYEKRLQEQQAEQSQQQ